MISVLRPDWPQLQGRVGFLSTLRTGGVSLGPWGDGAGGGGLNLGAHVGDDPLAVARNRERLCAVAGAQPLWLQQVHGVAVVNADDITPKARPGQAHAADIPVADASMATRPGRACAILTADCMPVLLADAEGKVVGAAHAGWRGLAGGVLEACVQAMRGAGAGHILAWLGPAIGPAQFEVGEDVVAAFTREDASARAAFVPRPEQPGKYLADLAWLARQRLHHMGIEDVQASGHCTVSEPHSFYSYRRDRVTGRMATLIWKM